MTGAAIGLLLAAAAAAAPTVTPNRLPPVEQCRGDPEFARYRQNLEDAVTRKDVAALRRVTAANVMVNFGGGATWDDFVRQWALDSNSSGSSLWNEMRKVIALGCAPAPGGGGRVFPSLFEAVGDDIDPWELVVARQGAPLYERPDARGKAIARLDWHSARLLDTAAPDGWGEVQLLDDNRGRGWLRISDWISPLGYRLLSERRGGRWVMTAFIAGD